MNTTEDRAPALPRKFSLWQWLHTIYPTLSILSFAFFGFFLLLSSRAYVDCSCADWLPTEGIYSHSTFSKGSKGGGTTHHHYTYEVGGQQYKVQTTNLEEMAGGAKFEVLYIAARPYIARPAEQGCFSFSLMPLSLGLAAVLLLFIFVLPEFFAWRRLLRFGILAKAQRISIADSPKAGNKQVEFEFVADKKYILSRTMSQFEIDKIGEGLLIIYLPEAPHKAKLAREVAKLSPAGELILSPHWLVTMFWLLSLGLIGFALLMPLDWFYWNL